MRLTGLPARLDAPIGDELLTLVDEAELAQRRHPRVPGRA
jgi:hypothetical protein